MFRRFIPFLLICALVATCIAEEIPSGGAAPDPTPDPAIMASMPVPTDVSIGYFDNHPDIVRDAQKRLAKLGFYIGATDGKYGKYSEDAVRAFQRRFGLEETGHLDDQTLALVKAYSDDNVTTKAIQQRLIDLGYLQSSATGYFGEQTEAGLRLFKQINQIDEAGLTGPETIAALFADGAIALPAGVSARSPREDIITLQKRLARFGFMDREATGEFGGVTAGAVKAFQQHLNDQGQSVEITGEATPVTLYYLYDENYSSYLHDVSEGMTDGEVARVEQRLCALGYLDAPADDAFDDQTREALCLFQQKTGLEPTGVADRAAIDMLFSDRAAALPAGVSPESDEKAVARLQKTLIRLCFMAGEADGVYGDSTAEAVQAFQRHLIEQGLPVSATGSASSLTLYYLYGDDYSTYLRDVSAGTTGGEAARVERRLAALGYMDTEPDDAFDRYAQEALRLFQHESGLEATGTADRATIDALFSDRAASLPAGLSPESEGRAVLRLQNRLIRYGFMAEAADAAYGDATAEAVQAFQQHLIDQGLPVAATGSASPLTLYYLYSEEYSTYSQDISVGAEGDEARRVEQRLAALGYMDAEPDDAFDDYARDALILFQQRAGLKADGTADRVTVDALFAEDVPASESSAPHEINSGDSGSIVRDIENALLVAGYAIQLPDGKYDAAMERAISNAAAFLNPGDSATHLSKETVAAFQNGLLSDFVSADTYRVQRRLHTLFYLDKAGVDGTLGEQTVVAWHEFQQTNGLPQTDVGDRATLSLLFSEGAVAKRYPYRVDVSLSRQVVEIRALNSQNTYDLVQTFTCSTGKNNTTPRGIFLNAFPQDRWHYFKKFLCWAQYSFVIEGDILFHSVIYGRKNENSLHTSSLRALGNPASHGCVRLSVDDAKWLFEHCEKGSLVIVIS